MKTKYAAHTQSGFSLIELLTTVSIIAIMAAIALPTLGGINSEAKNLKDKRNAQTIVMTYSTGDAAGVQWPSGNVATKVAAVLTGQNPPSGAFVTTTFKATLSAEEAALTYKFIRANANGDLFIDPDGGQNVDGL